MRDYSQLGYNSQMQKIGGLLDSQTDQTSAYDFNFQTSSASVLTKTLRDSSVTNAKIVNLEADKIEAGTISVGLSLGTANIVLDGENTRILINDGSDDRILIGYQSGGF